MNYESIIKGLFDQCRVVNELDLTATDGPCQLHLTNDGEADQLTISAIESSALKLRIIDSDVEDEGMFDESNVEEDDFDLREALAPIQHGAWKFIELTVDADGTMVLVFLNVRPSHLKVDNDGKIIDPVFALVPFGSLCEHLVALLEAQDGHWQYIITQDYSRETETSETTILELCDGHQANSFESKGGSGTEEQQPYWHLTAYGPIGEAD